MNNYSGTVSHILLTILCCYLNIGWLAVAFFIGREIAQSEYRYIEANSGKRYKCPWYCGFLPSAWTLKGLLDWALPLIITIIYNSFLTL